MFRPFSTLIGFGALAALVACSTTQQSVETVAKPAATSATLAANAAFNETLPWADNEDEALAARGFIATLDDPVIRGAKGQVVYDLSAFDFAEGEAPDTVNPSLWRHLKLLRQHGLFEVAPGIWQVRGFDLSVMSILATQSGYVVVDPLLSEETAAAALGLVKTHLGDKPVHAVIYTHSHSDHYAGVKGVISVDDVAAGRVQVLAPDGFMEHSVSETLVAGPAMSRRATYQFGLGLEPGPVGAAGSGIGATLSRGSRGLIAPTRTIKRTGEHVVIDGLLIEFQVTPGSEAPAEMNFYLPQSNALCLAENANVTMHNVLTPRGALVRDARAWAHYMTESDRLYGDKAQVLFNSHGWPRWGNDNIREFVRSHRDAYKYLHDQSVRLMNAGHTEMEIGEQIALPESLAGDWFNRGYYGTMSHNSKAVYQRYMGWYDGNPANLNPWPPEEAGRRYVDAMGGPDAALEVARKAYGAGDYRWAAQVANHLAFADPANQPAREVMARSFEQLAYQAEGMLWRNMYLVAAREARKTPDVQAISTLSPDMVQAIDTADILELLAVRVNPQAAKGKDVSVRFVFPDRKERFLVSLRNSVLVQQPDAPGEADATVTLPRMALVAMLFGQATPAQLADAGRLTVEGDAASLQALLSSLDQAGDGKPFPIVTP